MNATAVHEGFVPAGRNRLPQILLAGFVVVWVLAAIKPLYVIYPKVRFQKRL